MKVIVPHYAVRILLVQKYIGEKRAQWVIVLQEYDLEIKPANIIHGQGLCKLVTQTIDSKYDNDCDNQETEHTQEVCVIHDVSNLKYSYLIYYLTHGTSPLHFNAKNKHSLRIKEIQYQLVNGILFRKNYDSMLLRCLEKEEVDKVLFDLHDGTAGGHFGGDTTAHKI
jgi:hypothetical protein